jgi:hypothetical protein
MPATRRVNISGPLGFGGIAPTSNYPAGIQRSSHFMLLDGLPLDEEPNPNFAACYGTIDFELPPWRPLGIQGPTHPLAQLDEALSFEDLR